MPVPGRRIDNQLASAEEYDVAGTDIDGRLDPGSPYCDELLGQLRGRSPARCGSERKRRRRQTSPVRVVSDASQPGAQFGFTVSAAGDVDRDGYADILIGSPLRDGDDPTTDVDVGRAVVWFGSATGFRDGAPSVLANPAPQANGRFGWIVATAGDVDGDGRSDLLVGAPWHESLGAGMAQEDEGNAFVYQSAGNPTSAEARAVILDNPRNYPNGRFGTLGGGRILLITQIVARPAGEVRGIRFAGTRDQRREPTDHDDPPIEAQASSPLG